nr:hypothetical protein Iba_chr03bCG6800 [Ipomoea batatas]
MVVYLENSSSRLRFTASVLFNSFILFSKSSSNRTFCEQKSTILEMKFSDCRKQKIHKETEILQEERGRYSQQHKALKEDIQKSTIKIKQMQNDGLSAASSGGDNGVFQLLAKRYTMEWNLLS